MINYNYLSDYQIVNENKYSNWIIRVVESEGKIAGEITYILCSDEYLLGINQKYLDHNTFTDIITFDYSSGRTLSGDIFISMDRIKENAIEFKVSFNEELRRVMSHGVLHLSGYGDKEKDEIILMRELEEEKMKLFHVEQN